MISFRTRGWNPGPVTAIYTNDNFEPEAIDGQQ